MTLKDRTRLTFPEWKRLIRERYPEARFSEMPSLLAEPYRDWAAHTTDDVLASAVGVWARPACSLIDPTESGGEVFYKTIHFTPLMTTCQLRNVIRDLEARYPKFDQCPRWVIEHHYMLCNEYWHRPDWPCMEPYEEPVL